LEKDVKVAHGSFIVDAENHVRNGTQDMKRIIFLGSLYIT